MELLHTPEPSSETHTIATDIQIADTITEQAIGLMFQREIPDDYALVMPFSTAKIRGVHTAFVFTPIDVVWTTNETVTKVKTFHPFRTIGFKKADCIIELPAGTAENITPGDSLALTEPPSTRND